MQLFRFRRIDQATGECCRFGEVAFSERHLGAKLDGDMAFVIHPGEPWWVRAWRRLRPLRGVACPLGETRIVTLKRSLRCSDCRIEHAVNFVCLATAVILGAVSLGFGIDAVINAFNN